MLLFVDILLILFDCDIHFARTKSQPLIPYQSVIQPNSFKSQCKNFIEFYDIKWDQTEIIPSKINRIYQKDKKRSKKIYDTFIESLKKLQKFFLNNSNPNKISFPFYQINSINNINNNYIHNNHYNNNYNLYQLQKNILKNEPKKTGFACCNLQKFQNNKNCRNRRSFGHIAPGLVYKNEMSHNQDTNHSIKSSSTCTTELDENYNNGQNGNLMMGRNQNLSKFKLENNNQATNNIMFTNYIKPQTLNQNNYKILNNNHNHCSVNNNNNNHHPKQMNLTQMQPMNVRVNNNNNNNINNGDGLNLINGNNMLLIPVGNMNMNMNQNRVNQISMNGLNYGQQQAQSTVFGYQFLTFGQGFPSILIKEYRFNSN